MTACADLKPSGAARVPPPDAVLTAPCPTPEAVTVGAASWEAIAGRLGVALIRCGQTHAALAAWSTDVVETLRRP
jgi:hypothetical protein